MFAKRFFYASAGILCLALAYHFGATSATAQQGTMVSGFAAETFSTDGNRAMGVMAVMTPNGDIYCRSMDNLGAGTGLVCLGNFWGGGPIPTQRETFGSVKARYR